MFFVRKKEFFIKRTVKILVATFALLVSLQVAGLILLQFPGIQTFIGKKIVNSLSNSINGEITIGNTYIIFFNKVIIKDIAIVSKDKSPLLDSLKANYNQSDTLLACNKLSLSLDPSNLIKGNLKLNKIYISGGVFNLQNEQERQTNLDRIFKLEKDKPKDTTKKRSLNLLANTLRINDFRFTLNNPDKLTNKGDSIINFSNLDVKEINVDISDVHLKRDTVYASINNISGKEKSGFTIKRFSGNARVCGKETLVSDLHVEDNYTVLNTQYFYLKYDSPRDFADFTEKVVIGTALEDTYLDFKTIGRIAPSLYNSSLSFFLNGEISGTVDNIDTKSLIATSKSGQTFLDLGARIIGLPDVSSTMAVVQIKNSYTTCADIASIVASINNTPKNKFLSNVTPFTGYCFKGSLMGLLDDFVIDGKINSAIGNIDLDILFRNESGKGVRFDGKISTDSLSVGDILANNMFGELTMESGINALFKRDGGMEVNIDSIRINKLHFNDYDYSNIYAEGKQVENLFNGKIICHDPNIDFIFQGLFSFGNEGRSNYDFKAFIPYADLAALNFDKRYDLSVVSLNSTAKFTRFKDNQIIGKIDMKNTKYQNPGGTYNLGNITLQSLHINDIYKATARAPFIKADYTGSAPVMDFVKKVSDIIYVSKLDNFVKRDTALRYNDGNYRLNIETFNTAGICEALVPGLYLMDSTEINLSINSGNTLRANVKSGRVAFNKNFIKDFNLKINSGYNKSSTFQLDAKKIRVAGMEMDSNTLKLIANNNNLDVSYNFRNDSTGNNNAGLLGEINFKPEREIDINIKDGTEITLKGEKWSFTPSAISITDSLITVNDFKIKNNSQLFELEGNISKYYNDSLTFNLRNFNIGIFNLFLNKSFDLEGIFSGNGLISDLYRAPRVFFDITGDSVYVFKNPVGTLKLMSKWNNTDNVLNLLAKSSLNDKVTLSTTGYYKPDNGYLDIRASLEEFSVCYFEPFLSDLISKSSGSLSGELRLSGTLDKLALTGRNCNFNDLGFTVNFTNVPYRINGPVTLNERGIYFKDLPIYDQFGSRGVVNGNLTYNYFRDVAINTTINFSNLQCLKTTEKENEYFYGNAYATGSLAIKGPLNNIKMNIDVLSNDKTSIHIPLSSSATATQTNILTFVPKNKNVWVDPYENYIKKEEEEKTPSQLDVNLRANVTPEAEIMIEINKSVGDVIKATGNGLINMEINPSKEIFDIFGDYNVNSGSYKFVLAGFAAKDFTLEKGGTINFNGDIGNTNIDLDAVYQTKASINTLIADTSSISTRRNVYCTIGMEGKLTNPELTFNIDIPDLDPTTKMRVESALNTSGKIQKQFMAVLVSGGFIPDEQSGIANNSSILYSNASEILSNQINMIFQQLGIPLDLGLNYQPGEQGTDIFDVAVSTQLFNNRVIINGNIGNDPYASSNRDVVGNIDVEIKLDNPGNTRLNLFSHAEDQYSSYNDNNNSQRSGIGMVYQKEFNSFRSLVRGKSKAQKVYEKQEKAKRKALKKKEEAK